LLLPRQCEELDAKLSDDGKIGVTATHFHLGWSGKLAYGKRRGVYARR
jgi:hypothetical protein